jgi:hypothetical protein
MRLFTILLYTFFSVSHSALCANEYDMKSVKSRRSLESIYAEFTLEISSPSSGNKRIECKQWQSGSKHRRDFHCLEGCPHLTEQQYSCVNCEKEGWQIFGTRTKNRAAKHIPIPKDGENPGPSRPFPNLLTFGFKASQYSMNHHGPFDSIVGSSDQLESTSSYEVISGTNLMKRSYRKTNDVRMTYWLDPDRNFAPVRILLNSENLQIETESSDFQSSKDGHFFPRKIISSQSTSGKVDWTETITLTKLILNEPINTNVFTLAGIGLPNGTYVSQPDYTNQKGNRMPGSGVLDDGKIVQPKREHIVPLAKPTSPIESPRSSWLYSVVAILCSLFAVFVLYLRRRVSRQRVSS